MYYLGNRKLPCSWIASSALLQTFFEKCLGVKESVGQRLLDAKRTRLALTIATVRGGVYMCVIKDPFLYLVSESN